MGINLEKDLPHQQGAVNAINSVFAGVKITPSSYHYINPSISIHSETLKKNIQEIQRTIHSSLRGINDVGEYLNLDIKMETGTGKTYVYTQMIYELHKNYGLNKFIILVPTLPIKAGTGQFIKSDSTKRHFRDECKYNAEIELNVFEARKSKKGKEFFPSTIRDFVCASNLVKNKIQVLLVNMQLFQDKKGGMLTKEYDYAAEGFWKPSEALRAVKPIIIIDEPHRFSKENKTFEFIEKHIRPQCIIRFGATFPEVEKLEKVNVNNKDKTVKIKIKDHHNLIYNLGSCDAFNKNLIKGVRKEHIDSPSGNNVKVKLLSTHNRESATFQIITKNDKQSKVLNKEDSLAMLHPDFEGVHISGIGKSEVELSNGKLINVKDEIYADVYSSSYQELIIYNALFRHFETERENYRRKYKIKTLCLFFIDDIESYRYYDKKENNTYLEKTFERLLLERIDKEIIDTAGDEELIEYREYLEATKVDVKACHEGYFASDNSESNVEYKDKIEQILFDKEKLLSIRDDKGKFNTLRFIFSKWTLKEGWDNPNVFTIAKLRSSGSEISKLQEVGRGLRLPVDENGNRLSKEGFFLNYIVDFTEKDFADQLVKEINGDMPETSIISEDVIAKLAAKMGMEYSLLLGGLMFNGFIDSNRLIKEEKRQELFATYPDLETGLGGNKVTDRNKNEPQKVKVRADKYKELKELWEKINQRYFIKYKQLDDGYMLKQILGIIKTGIYSPVTVTSHIDTIVGTNEGVSVVKDAGLSMTIERTLPYNEFLKLVSDKTNLPIGLLHKAFVEYSHDNDIIDEFFNQNTVANLIIKFGEWKKNNLCGIFNYQKTNAPIHPTALTNKNGEPKDVITQGLLGTKNICGVAQEKYLYDICAFDSDLEKTNITTIVDGVTVFGKIPKSSIRIPVVGGGTYSPDFMYVVKKSDGKKELNIVIESKDVEAKVQLRGEEILKIDCAKIFFEQLKLDGYEVKFIEQLKKDQIKGIIDEVIK